MQPFLTTRAALIASCLASGALTAACAARAPHAKSAPEVTAVSVSAQRSPCRNAEPGEPRSLPPACALDARAGQAAALAILAAAHGQRSTDRLAVFAVQDGRTLVLTSNRSG